MPDYVIGRARTQRDRQTSCTIHVTVSRRVYDRLVLMQQALQRELGPEHTVTLASICRRILYQHGALRTIARRHYQEPDDDGNSLVT